MSLIFFSEDTWEVPDVFDELCRWHFPIVIFMCGLEVSKGSEVSKGAKVSKVFHEMSPLVPFGVPFYRVKCDVKLC